MWELNRYRRRTTMTTTMTDDRRHILHSLCAGWRNLPTLRVGWRNLFSSCAVVSVFGSGGK